MFKWIIVSYLCGSIPIGYVLGKLRGIDIREHGSGNIGATNVMRVLGRKTGILVLFLDMLKGLLPVLYITFQTDSNRMVLYLSGVAAILGHMYPLWLKFRGGKGVATSLGVFLALVPRTVVIGVLVFAVVVGIWRMVSLGSIVSAVLVPVLCFLYEGDIVLGTVAAVLGLLIIFRHRENLRRIVSGRENKIF